MLPLLRVCKSSTTEVLWQIGQYRSISSGEELKALQAQSIPGGITVLDMADWRIIPAENLVAAFQVLSGNFPSQQPLVSHLQKYPSPYLVVE